MWDGTFKRSLFRKNLSCSNDICRLTGSSLLLGSRYLSFGSSYPPLDTPLPKLTARINTTLPARRVATPLHLQMHQILSATSSRGLMLESWEVYGSFSCSCRHVLSLQQSAAHDNLSTVLI